MPYGVHGTSNTAPAVAGTPGTGYGMGGGSAQGGAPGGTGSAGFVIVEEFY